MGAKVMRRVTVALARVAVVVRDEEPWDVEWPDPSESASGTCT